MRAPSRPTTIIPWFDFVCTYPFLRQTTRTNNRKLNSNKTYEYPKEMYK